MSVERFKLLFRSIDGRGVDIININEAWLCQCVTWCHIS